MIKLKESEYSEMKKADINKLIGFIVSSGKEIVSKAGTINDKGIKKQFLTEEDLRIERGIKEIIGKLPGQHYFYAEEENNQFIDADSVWIVDPISGTKLFIEGKPHYAIVVSHLSNGRVDLVIVYDPTVDELFMGNSEGAFLNGKKLVAKETQSKKIIFAPSYGWKDLDQIEKLKEKLESKYEVYPSQGSLAINYCLVVKGLFNGVVSLTKDAFPEFAGLFIANKSGLKATNLKGHKDIVPDDRVFICGTLQNYNDLLNLTKEVIS